MTAPERSRPTRRAYSDPDLDDRRAALAQVIPRRAGVSWWLGVVLAVSFAVLATPTITAERWLLRFHEGSVVEKLPAPFTVRSPMLAGYEQLRVRGGVVVARGEPVTRDQAAIADAIADAMPRGPVLYLAFFAVTLVLASLFTHHMRRSTKGRLVRVQVVSLAVIAVLAVVVKLGMLSTALSALVVPVAVLAMVPTMALDRIVGLATGVLAALVVSLQAPFDVGLAIMLLVQAATAGLVVSERPKRRWVAALAAGLVTTLCTGATYLLLTYLTTGGAPELRDPLHSAWVAAAIGPAIAALVAVPLLPLYQLLVGEITQSKLFALEDLGHPLLRQIAERSPGTWQHSLMMANMAEIAANAIGASGRLVRVGAYFHDLGKSLSPKYFIENLEPGETSPHDQLPPEVSCDAIFAHVTEGIVTARKAGLHERIVDFMHMHHGNGVLEYFWAKCREQGNPRDFTIEDFRYPGHPPQSRETAILTICDAVEAASRTLKKPDAASIDSLVQRIVYGKLHLGQLDESGLSMSDLRRISDSLRETIRHANHARIEYPWQKAGQDASASVMSYSSTTPRLDSLDRRPGRDTAARSSMPPPADSDAALAATADVKDPASGSAAAAHGAAPSSEPGDARIRAGTARNAYASSPPAGDSSDAGRAREVRAAEIYEAAAREAEARDAELRDAEARDAELRDAEARDAELRDAEARDAELRDAEARDAELRDAEARDAERIALGLDHRAHGDAERRGAKPHDDGAHEPSRVARTTARGPVAIREPGSAPVRDARAPDRDSGAMLGDGMAAIGDPAPAPSRDSGTTLGDGMAAIRDPGSAPSRDRVAPSRDPITLRDGLVPSRDPGSAPSRDPITLRDGMLPSREPRSTSTRDDTAPSRAAGTTLRGAVASSRDAAPETLREVTGAPVPGAASTLRDGASIRDAGPPPGLGHAPVQIRDAGPPPALDHTTAPTRNSLTTIPGRAPGPLGPPPDLITPQMFGDKPAAPHTATLPAGQPQRTPTAPPPIERRDVADEPARSAGPPPPVDLDNAITNPPPLRRGPSGHPPVPSDSAQIAAALASLVSRVRAAPFGIPATGEHPARAAAQHDDLDNAITNPPPLGSLAPSTPSVADDVVDESLAMLPLRSPARAHGTTNPIDNAITRPLHPSRAQAADTTDSAGDGATTEPLLARAPAPAARAVQRDPAITEPARGAAPGGATRRTPSSPPLRTSGLADGERRQRPPEPPRALHERHEHHATHAAADLDAGVTEPSLPVLAVGDERRVDLPLRPPSPERAAGWSSGLAARIDAALDSDEWNRETPIVPPTKAELRALLGQPDPTRQQPIDEIELLQRRAAELSDGDPPRRSPHPTAEVDPDDIEAAIELAPPARRPTHVHAIGVAKPKPKPKKSE
jgi:putative nucleotidyltransferase with HDIG domain